jgi:hypothetical protein
MYKCYSLHWNNVNPDIVSAQQRVFRHFGYDIDQQCIDGMDHAQWIDSILENSPPGQTTIIVDIDCVPLNADVLASALKVAANGGIFGCAQSANHLEATDFVYAGPMFLAISGETWRKCGSPSARADETFDVGARLTFAAMQKGIPIELIYPTSVAVPKWPLGDKYIFGLFTVYEQNVLHLFQSRNNALIKCFTDVSHEIVNGTLDIRSHLIEACEESHRQFQIKKKKKESRGRKYKRLAQSFLSRFN